MKAIYLHKLIPVIIGIFMLVNAIISAVAANMNVGTILTFLMGCMFVLYSVFYSKIYLWLKRVFIIGIIMIFGCISALIIYGSTDTVTYNEDVLIILGTSVHGKEPSEALKSRLDCAIDYYAKNPDVIMILSGGQGPQEDISESLAMEKYLLDRGIPENRLLNEDKSTSTFENFTFSKPILDRYLTKQYSVAFVTNEFHIYRASSLAQLSGFDNITHIHSSTKWYTLINCTLRECLAVVKLWIFKC